MRPTRREFLRGSLALAALPAKSRLALGEGIGTQHHVLWYKSGAKRWFEAMPIGNGRLAGMVFGGITKERIALTESTVWSGAPSSSDVNPGGAEHLSQIRELLFQEDYVQARKLCEQYLLSHPTSFGTNLPLLDLVLEFSHPQEIVRQRRMLDLDEGVAKVDYQTDGHRFTREMFASNPSDVLVVHLESDTPGRLSFKAGFEGVKLPGKIGCLEPDILFFRGQAFESMHSDGKQGVEVETHLRLLHLGGKLKAGADYLEVDNADSVTLIVAIATSYGGRTPAESCRRALEVASNKTYEELSRIHIADHQSLFGRVQIELGSRVGDTGIATDQRRSALEAGAGDPGLCALFFQDGRYLTIAGSRFNSPLPLALQGIWNDGLASSMGWTDDFHLDINTQQNYWTAEVCNLGECQGPLFGPIDGLRISGRKTAKEMYGTPGWVCHTVTNAWGYTAPGWGLGWGLYVTGGIWIVLQMWDHYLFNADAEFLRTRAYPVLREAAEFFLAYMVPEPKHGWLVTGPSDSPENWYVAPSGAHATESMGDTCDRTLVYALYTMCIEASKALSVDPEFRRRIERARAKLPPFQIGRHGQLQEW